MKPRLKKLSEQVVVITGASSGIGLATARMAARQGARLVLAARNGQALGELNDELRAEGCEAIHVVADVGKLDDVRKIGEAAISRFGGFDTWINNAGVSIYGCIDEVPLEDHRRLFDTNFWGVVHGSMVAASHLRQGGGAIINLGSEVSDLAIPLQGMYSASKHAVKGFTDALRIELEAKGAPVCVTLIKPTAVDSMFVEHARNYLDVEPKLPAPLYAPKVAAEAILHAAQHPSRDIFVGGRARLAFSGAHFMPRLMDRYLQRFMFRQQRSRRPAREHDTSALHVPGVGLHERRGQPGRVHETSLYTTAALHPARTAALVLGAGLALAAVLWQQRPARRLLKGLY
jgi:short-subunit dehydrogenase